MDVGLEGVDNPRAVVGSYGCVVVDVPDRVNNDAAPRLLGPDYVAVVREAFDFKRFNEYGVPLAGFKVYSTALYLLYGFRGVAFPFFPLSLLAAAAPNGTYHRSCVHQSSPSFLGAVSPVELGVRFSSKAGRFALSVPESHLLTSRGVSSGLLRGVPEQILLDFARRLNAHQSP